MPLIYVLLAQIIVFNVKLAYIVNHVKLVFILMELQLIYVLLVKPHLIIVKLA
jgi:hypothetical protein